MVGLGLMGAAFASRLAGRGWAVLGCDVDVARCNTADRLGVVIAEPPAILQRCDTLILSLPSHHEVAEVLTRNAAHLRRGQIIVDTTTGSPDRSEAMAHELALSGVDYLDATISGNSAQAREGTAVAMVGGDAEAFAACRPLFTALVAEAFHTGRAGTGAKMKLVTNLVLGLNRAALAEGLALAEAAGLDPELAFQVMRSTPAYSRIMDVKGEKMLRSEFSPDARLSQHLKDVRLMLELGGAAGLPMTLSHAHRAVLEAAEAAGLGNLDNSALIQVLRGVTGSRRGER